MMNGVLAMVASVSAAASILMCVLLLAEKLWGRKVRWSCWYFLWAVVVIRLLIPFGPSYSPAPDPASGIPATAAYAAAGSSGSVARPVGDAEPASMENAPETETPAEENPLHEAAQYLWVVWLAGLLILLARRITAYQSFNRCIRAGLEPCEDLDLLNAAAEAAEEAGVRRPVELGTHPLISSPLLLGWRRPCVVLPSGDCSPEEARNIVLHELTHLKRGDAVYKWATQIAVCVHWFNPLAHYMARRISRLCELSCDEEVIRIAGGAGARSYGETLLRAMGGAGRFQAAAGTMELSANKKLIRERICSLKDHAGSKPLTAVLAVVLACVMAMCVACTRVYDPWPRRGERGGALNRVQRAESGAIDDALEVQPALRIEASDVWLRVEYGDGTEIETDADPELCDVKMLRDEDACEDVLTVSRSAFAGDMRSPAVVRVPRSGIESLDVSISDAFAQIPADGSVRATSITCDNSVLFVCNEEEFDGVGVDASLTNSFVMDSENFEDERDEETGLSVVTHPGDQSSVFVAADGSFVAFDEAGAADAFTELAKNGFRGTGAWRDLIGGLAGSLVGSSSDGQEGGTGLDALFSGVGSLLRDIGENVGGLLSDIGGDLRDIGAGT